MSLFLHSPVPFKTSVLFKCHNQNKGVLVRAATSTPPQKKTRGRRKQKSGDDSSSSSNHDVSAAEQGLRLIFMEELMQHARNRDAQKANDVIYDMIAAGLSPGPRSFHGLVVAHVLNGDDQGAVWRHKYYTFVTFRRTPKKFVWHCYLRTNVGNNFFFWRFFRVKFCY